MHRKRGRWLTPDSSAAAGLVTCRRFRLAGDLLYLLGGAVEYLAESGNWEEFGDMTPEQISAYFREMIDSAQDGCMIGEIKKFAGALPAGILACDGALYNVVDYPLLAAYLGDNGNGTFNVPDYRNLTLIGAGLDFALGDTGGEAEHTLTVAEIPAHAHSYDQIVATLIDPGVTPSVIGIDDINAVDTGSTGGGGAHNNMQPYAAVNYGIVAL